MQSVNKDFCIDSTVCNSDTPLPFLPMEVTQAIDTSFIYSWCENSKSDLTEEEKKYDFNRDVTHMTSTGLKMTESCPIDRQFEIEKTVMGAYNNLFNCFRSGNGKFPDPMRYNSIKESFNHIIENGGLKIKCNIYKNPPRSSNIVGAKANTYIANTAKGYREPWTARSPYIADGNGINAPDQDRMNLARSTYEPSVMTLNFIPKEKEGFASIPLKTFIMHELLHLPGELSTFSGFRFDNLDAENHNYLFQLKS